LEQEEQLLQPLELKVETQFLVQSPLLVVASVQKKTSLFQTLIRQVAMVVLVVAAVVAQLVGSKV
jgi:hypothetical protein